MRYIIACALLYSLAGLMPAAAQTTYFHADAEDSAVSAPGGDWDGTYQDATGQVTLSTTQKKNGSKSYRFQTSPPANNDAKVVVYGSGRAYHTEAYYSGWYYIESGYNDTLWKNDFQWKLANGTSPGTICKANQEIKTLVGITVRNGVRQWLISMPDCQLPGGGTACERFQPDVQPTVTPFPTGQWVFTEIFYRASKTNGQIRMWQDGVEIINWTNAQLDTLSKVATDPNCSGDGRTTAAFLYFGAGSYVHASSNAAVIYGDDFRITSFPMTPILFPAGGGDETPPGPPTNLQLTSSYPGHMLVDWDAPTGSGEAVDVAGYNVERCQGPSCSNFVAVATPGSGTTSYLDTGLARGESYTYRVRAFDEIPNPGTYATMTQSVENGALVSHWDMENGTGTTATDIVGGHNGTLTGNGVTWNTATPRVGTAAISLAGSDDYVEVADHNNLDFGDDQNFTWEFWVKTSATNPGSGVFPQIVRKRTAPTGIEIIIDGNDASKRWLANIGHGNAYGCTAINTGAWIHLAVVREGDSLKTYQNGAPCNTTTSGTISNSIINAGSLYFGIFGDETTWEYTGDIDDVRLYNYARSAAEIGADAAPEASLVMTHFRFHAADRAIGAEWLAEQDLTRKLRSEGSFRVRFQIQNLGTTTAVFQPALQCRIVPASFAIVPDALIADIPELGYSPACLAAKACVHPDAVLTEGDDGTTSAQLTLPGGGTYADGQLSTSTTWRQLSLAPDAVGEVEFRVRTTAITPTQQLCCRPAKSDGTPLDEYNPAAEAACLTGHAGYSGLIGG